jgi:hypothetical protein
MGEQLEIVAVGGLSSIVAHAFPGVGSASGGVLGLAFAGCPSGARGAASAGAAEVMIS